jgi:integrase
MRGHLKERSPGHWAIVIDVPDPQTGARRRKWHAFRGNKRAAQNECARLIAELSRGAYVDRTTQTVGSFVSARIVQWEAAGNLTARSAERYRFVFNQQIVPHIGTKQLQKLTRLDIEGWHTALRNAGLAPRTIALAHRVLGRALIDAERDGLLTRNVCRLQRAPQIKDAEDRAIVLDVPGLIEKLRGHRLYVISIVALFTGLRLGEVLALRDQNLDLDRGLIRVREALEPVGSEVRFKAPKTKAGRRDISLPAIVIETLRTHRRELLETRMHLGLGRLNPEDLLFADLEGRPLAPRGISMAWANFATQVGMPEITFHALRHTHASQLIAQGVDIVTISRRLGHANPNITLKVYAHLFAVDDSKAAAAINALRL